MNWTPAQPFQALALTGGGFRGLFAANALAKIEDHIGRPVAQHFDLISGTSIGGIVALAAAFEVPMKEVVRVISERGNSIFPLHKQPSSRIGKYIELYKYAKRPRYSTDPLRSAICELIPAKATLGDAKYPVVIPAVNLTEGRPQIFKTRHKAEWNRDWRLNAVEVALATAAAPTFFELADVSGALYADGGLFANAPDLIAIHEAEHFFGVNADSIRLLSIGTTTKSYSISFRAGRAFGISDWMEDLRLFSVMISAQQQFIDQLIQHRLGDNYLRIDKEPSHEQARDLGLDVATPVAIKTLKALADKAVTDQLGRGLDQYLSHSPQLKPIKND